MSAFAFVHPRAPPLLLPATPIFSSACRCFVWLFYRCSSASGLFVFAVGHSTAAALSCHGPRPAVYPRIRPRASPPIIVKLPLIIYHWHTARWPGGAHLRGQGSFIHFVSFSRCQGGRCRRRLIALGTLTVAIIPAV